MIVKMRIVIFLVVLVLSGCATKVTLEELQL